MTTPARVFAKITQPNLTAFSVTDSQLNRSASIYIRNEQNDSEFLSTRNLKDALETFTQKAESVLRPFSTEGWKEKAPQHLAPIATATRALQQAGIARQRELDTRWQTWTSPDKNSDPAQRQEIRTSLRGLSSQEVLRRVTVNPMAAIAILELPDGIATANDPDIRQHLERLAATYNLERIFAGQSNREPSLADPFAYGMDNKNAKALAAGALQNFETWRDEANDTRLTIQQAVQFFSVACDLLPEKAFITMGLGA